MKFDLKGSSVNRNTLVPQEYDHIFIDNNLCLNKPEKKFFNKKVLKD
jgi:hypothetical protein